MLILQYILFSLQRNICLTSVCPSPCSLLFILHSLFPEIPVSSSNYVPLLFIKRQIYRFLFEQYFQSKQVVFKCLSCLPVLINPPYQVYHHMPSQVWQERQASTYFTLTLQSSQEDTSNGTGASEGQKINFILSQHCELWMTES